MEMIKILTELILGPRTMGRLALLPPDVGSVHLTLQQAFPVCLPPPGPYFLIPCDIQAGGADSLCYSSVPPGTFP